MHCKKQDRLVENYRKSMEYVNQKENKLLRDKDTYGIQTPFDEFGSQRLQYEWKVHQNCSPRSLNVDFKKVNKQYLAGEQRKVILLKTVSLFCRKMRIWKTHRKGATTMKYTYLNMDICMVC